MPQLSPALTQRIATRHGIVNKDELIADGFTQHSIRRLVDHQTIAAVHQGVYRLATSPDTFEQRCAAACLADQSVVITGRAAGHLWGFRHVGASTVPIALVEHDRKPLARGVIIRRSNIIEDEDIVERADGIRVASPPRSWFDCARDLSDERFEMLTEWVLDHHANVPTLWHIVQRLNQQGRPGLARVRRVFSARSAWQKPAGSGLELKVLRALELAGIPELVRQHPIPLPDQSVVHPDGALPDLRWAVEIDHVTWHGGRFDAQYDKGRDRKLRKLRWQVERITDAELRADFNGTIAEVVEMYRLRAQSFAA